jgi:hypothetical protein
MDGVVGDAHLFGARLLAELDDGFQNLGIGGCRHFRTPGPGEVGLDDHHVSFGDEPTGTARTFEYFTGQSFYGVSFCLADSLDKEFFIGRCRFNQNRYCQGTGNGTGQAQAAP